MLKIEILTLEEIAKSFGATVDNLGKSFQEFYKTLDMRYQVIDGIERENLLLEILKNIDEDKKVVTSKDRIDVWYNGWKENLDNFRNDKKRESIIPRFYRSNSVIRIGDNFVQPFDRAFEVNFVKLVLLYISNRFISSEIKNLYDFGCGSGLNLITLAQERPDIKIYGADFVQSSVELIDEIGKNFAVNVRGKLFNMIEPDYSFQIKKNSCAFTFASIEQLGNHYANFIQYLIYQKPQICFHVEPTLDFYDDSKIMDYLAIKFHQKRGYPTSLFSYLKNLEDVGKISICESRRFGFGSKMNEGYNLIVWEPR